MDTPNSYSATERLATSAVVAVISGLMLAQAAAHSLNRSIVLWLPLMMLAGALLGAGKRRSMRTLLKHSLVPALLAPLTFLGYLAVRATVNWSKNMQAPRLEALEIPISGPGDGSVTEFSSYFIVIVVLTLITIVASTLIVFLSSISSRMLVASLVSIFKFGPEGVEKASRIVIAATGLVAAVFAIWASVAIG